MKNKIIALTLSMILALSSTSAFAAEINYSNFNFYDFMRNYNTNYTESAVATPKADNTAATVQKSAKPATNNTAVASTKSNYEQRVAELVNVEREKNGLQSLAFNSSISNVARTKSKDMADNNYFAHQSPTYGSAADMLTQNGIKWTAWGENIASGQDTPEEVVNAWMNSEGHRANILSPDFTKIGVGYVTSSSGTPYWTQMFTR